MHSLPSAAEAAAILKPHMQGLCNPVYAAWRNWEKLARIAPDLRTALTPRARANNIHDWTIEQAKVSLTGRAGLSLTEQPGFLVVTIEDRLALRYKKFDEGLGTCGIPTNQRRLWTSQDTLEGMHELTYLVAGYQVDELGRLGGVAVTCSIGARVVWHLDAPEPGLAEITGIDRTDDAPGWTVRPLDDDQQAASGEEE